MKTLLIGSIPLRVLRPLLACTFWLVAATALGHGAEVKDEAPWRTLPLIVDGKVSDAWCHVGYGGFAVDDRALRTECSPKGLGLLVFKPEKFGNCQIRVVFRSQDAKSNAGLFVRIDDGILEQVDRPGAASSAISDNPPDAWKTMIVTLSGNRILVDLEGRRVTSFDPESPELPRERKWFGGKREPRRPEVG